MAPDPEQLKLMLQEGYVNPEFAEILKKIDGPAPGVPSDVTIPALRKVLADAKAKLNATIPNDANIVERDVSIPTRDGSSIALRIHSPPESLRVTPTPVFVALHGGGWCLGDLDGSSLLARKWCEEMGGICVNVDYRLAPEHKFPTGVWDCMDALVWTVEHANELGLDLASGFIVGGVSAGGNLAAVVSNLWKDEGRTPRLTGAFLSIPATLAPEAVPEDVKAEYRSRTQNENAPVLNAAAMAMLQRNYEPDPASPLFSPYLSPTGFAGLPRTYFEICGMDPLRDEGLLYERKLRESGVETYAKLYPGLPHAFWTFFSEADFSKQLVVDSLNGLRWLLRNVHEAKL